MENSIEFLLNTHIEWSLSHQDLVITLVTIEKKELDRALCWIIPTTYTNMPWSVHHLLYHDTAKQLSHYLYFFSFLFI